MPAANTFSCPSCEKTYRLKEGMAGKKVGCKCGERFRIPEAAAEDEEGGPLELSDGTPAWLADAAPAAAAAECSRCNAPLKPSAVLCLNCGTDQRTGAAAVAPPAGSGSMDDDGDDDAPAATHRRMTLTLWGINAQILSLLAKGLTLILGIVAVFASNTPAIEWAAVAVALAGAGLGGLGAVLCLFSPSPLWGRVVLAASLACYAAGFCVEVWAELGGAHWLAAAAATLLGVVGLLLFLGFLLSLAEHLDFPEVTDNANKVFGTTIGALAAAGFAWVLPFGTFLVMIGVLAMIVYAIWMYATLLIDLSRSVAYRRDRG
ncbi:hypothetical protein [Phycisphaera mikurensis]|uniref:Hypothetical membrane protein n=1 Tax=Phycisphaera mikurensis (strain NBRC 102666 / KCTC 22515 / FYK2301M01) TaxID=1142394 RepID=I0ID64_PHYMF|nr:hypothetical protein [Phycisphaera mikurensis]MBB6442327.1 hypothetical protein [Phycisphaera mikurensis]BAM03202.1 hypothetical membrane protein [Phycisphaera mikurensis NBRC 102666]